MHVSGKPAMILLHGYKHTEPPISYPKLLAHRLVLQLIRGGGYQGRQLSSEVGVKLSTAALSIGKKHVRVYVPFSKRSNRDKSVSTGRLI